MHACKSSGNQNYAYSREQYVLVQLTEFKVKDVQCLPAKNTQQYTCISANRLNPH